jgi:hypothetical protein
MDFEDFNPGEELTVVDEVLDAVKAARYQLGTLSHMGEDVENSVARLRAWIEDVLLFFAERRNVELAAFAVIAAAVLINHLRGWVSARFLRGWFYTFDPDLTPTGSALHRMARDIVRTRSHRPRRRRGR